MRRDVIERFEASTERVPMCGCWLWTGAQDRYGYGRFWVEGRLMKAHRAAWTMFRGPIPEGRWVLHRCDVPGCVNPDHLFLGDRADNMTDMARKGRQVFQANPEKIRRGERGPGARITDAQAEEAMRAVAAGESLGSVARRLGVTKGAIWAMKTGRIRRHQFAEITVRPLLPQQPDLLQQTEDAFA